MADELVTIRLHGPLADTYGAEHRMAIRTPREAVDALDANYPGFRRDFLKTERYGLFCDGDWREEQDGVNVALLPVSREIDFCPIIEGRIVGLLAAAVTWATAGAVTGLAATLIGGALAIGLLVGVSMLLTPKPKKPEDAKKDESFIFSGPENVTEQGGPVPLVYGRVHVGSVVISFGAEVTELPPPPAALLARSSLPYLRLDIPPPVENA